MWPQLERFETDVPGLDTVLNGGLVKGGVYLVVGRPGTGKTTLGNQIAHRHTQRGGTTIFATVLTETHGRMLAHLRDFSFLVPDQVANRLHYVSIYDELMEHGLEGALSVLRRLVREQQATLVVIDGAGLFRDFSADLLAFRRFIHELCVQLAALNCTVIMLSDMDGRDVFYPIGTHVDGIIVLEDESHQLQDVRFLHVVKIRGVDFLRGRHQFAITSEGIEVYPRLESSRVETSLVDVDSDERVPFGVAGLDSMLRGGVYRGSSTIILGAPGAGKTTTGLCYVLEGARRGERSLIAGFQETPRQLITRAERLGLPLGEAIEQGLVRIFWQPSLDVAVDAWAGQLLRLVDEYQPHRLFVDGVSDIQRLVTAHARTGPFLSALVNRLRSRRVTSLHVAEVNTLVGPDLEVPTESIAATAENIILLRYVELRSQLRRLISVLKMRGSDHDTSIREFSITDGGIEVATTFESAEAILTGVGRHLPAVSPRHMAEPMETEQR